MDLGDPRESLVSLKTPGTWEADNRVEERWQWGAQLLDLCNLSPEEYKNSTAVTVKTIQDCGECGGGGGGSSIADNVGAAVIDDNMEFSIVFDDPVATQLYVTVTFKDSDFEEYSFTTSVPKGSDTGTFDVSTISSDAPYEIISVKLGFKEDGSDAKDTVKDKKYEYSSTFEGDVAGKTYVISILCTKTDNLIASDYLNIIQNKGEGFDYIGSYDEITFNGEDTAEAVFWAICTNVDHWMPEAEEAQYFAEHSYDFVILTQEKIIEIKEDFTVDTDHWTEGTPVTINDSTFNKWMRRDFAGAQCPYSIDPDPCGDYELPYILKIKK